METLEARVYAGFPAFGIICGFICIFHNWVDKFALRSREAGIFKSRRMEKYPLANPDYLC